MDLRPLTQLPDLTLLWSLDMGTSQMLGEYSPPLSPCWPVTPRGPVGPVGPGRPDEPRSPGVWLRKLELKAVSEKSYH